MILSCQNISKSFGTDEILKNVSFHIEANEKAAIVGINGAGKSTLLKIIMQKETPDTGEVILAKDATIGYLAQYQDVSGHRTIYEEVLDAKKNIIEMEERLRGMEAQMNALTGQELEALLDGYHRLSHEFELLGGYTYRSEVTGILKGLGFVESEFDRQMSELSGGQKTRVSLGKLLVTKPDVLLLDEPTNHLDIDSIQWLEEFLISNGKAVVVISHDRTFVDNITTRTIEVTMGRIYDYKVNYSKYLELRKDRRAQQQKAYDEQQKMIAETKDFIERFKGTYSKTLQVQSRVKMLEKLELIEVDEEDTSALRLKFPPSPRSGSYPVIAQELSKYYGDHLVFKEAGFTIQRGEKVAFVGRNGEGKSTLVKCIMGEITDYTGKLTLGHNVQIGYFAQNQASLLDEELTVFQTVDDVTPSELKSNTKNLLGAFMFSGDDIDKKVKVLSGGERTRLAMIKLLLQPVNLLILDEPTNHLDLKTKDILKNALIDFDGTLIVVSHDRDFLNGLAQKVYEFGNGKVTEHLEDINGFLRKKKMENLREIESRKS